MALTQIHPEHSPNFTGANGVIMQVEASKLLPWLMLSVMLAGTALGISIGLAFETSHSESRMEAVSDRQYRYLQELRVRVEDAESAIKQAGFADRLPTRPTKER